MPQDLTEAEENPLSGGVYTPPIGNVTISSSPIHGPSGTKVIGPLVITLTQTSTDEVLALAFPGATSNLVTQPAEATLCVIKPPAANVVALTLGGAPDDVGVSISPSNPTEIAFPTTTGGATFYITSAAALTTGPVEVDFA